MAGALTGWEITEWAMAAAAFVTAAGVIHTKVIRPAVRWVRSLKTWMHETAEKIDYVQGEMQFNGGSTLRDESRQTRDLLATHLEQYGRDVDEITRRLNAAATSRAAMYERIEAIEQATIPPDHPEGDPDHDR